MADSSISINLESAQAAIDELKNSNNKVSIATQSFSTSAFNPLCSINPDLASNYVTEFTNSLAETYTFAEKIYTALLQYINNIVNIEGVTPDPNPGPSHSGNSSGGQDNIPNAPIVAPVDQGKQISNDLTNSIDGLNLKDLDGVVDELINISKEKGKGIDEILIDEKLSEELKNALLSSPYITDELKEVLNKLDSDTIRKTMLSIMNGERPETFEFNALNIGIVYAYLMQIASEKEITMEQLLNDSQYSDILKTALGDFDDVVEIIKSWEDLSAVEYQERLLKIYDGDDIGDLNNKSVSIIRTFSDYISDATEIVCEELLTDNKYAEVLKTATQQFAKTAIYMNATSHFSTKGMIETVSGILTGKNPEALGMTNEEIVGFKSEIDSLAQNKGISTETLLSNSSYANDVNDVLKNSANAEDIGIIYQKSDATVAQNVVKNIYNYEIKESSNVSLSEV